MMRFVLGVVLAVLVLVATTLAVNATQSAGMVPALSDGEGFEAEFASAWNDSSEFTCTNSSPFTVTATTGPCAGQSVTSIYDVNQGGISTQQHTFIYSVTCTNANTVTHSVAWDGGANTNIDNSGFRFTLGGDTVKLLTGPLGVPTLGEWGMIAFVAILLTSGIFLILRRYRPSPEAS